MVSVVSKKRKSTGAERREMVSTELQTGPGIVVVVVVVVDVVVAVLVGSGGYMLKVPRMIILFSKQRILKQKKKKEKKDDKVSRLQVAAIAYHTHSRSPMSSSTTKGGL